MKKIEKIASNMYHQPEIIGKMDIQALKNTVIDFIWTKFAILIKKINLYNKKGKSWKIHDLTHKKEVNYLTP